MAAAPLPGADQELFESLVSFAPFDMGRFRTALEAGANPDLPLCYLETPESRWKPAYGDQCESSAYVFGPIWAVVVGGADRSPKGDIPWSERAALVDALVEKGASSSEPFRSTRTSNGVRFMPLDAFVWDALPSNGADPWTPLLVKLIGAGWEDGYKEMVLTLDNMRTYPQPRMGKITVFRRVARAIGRSQELEASVRRTCESFVTPASKDQCPTLEQSLSASTRPSIPAHAEKVPSDEYLLSQELLADMSAGIRAKDRLRASQACRQWVGARGWIAAYCTAEVAHYFNYPDAHQKVLEAWSSFRADVEFRKKWAAEVSEIDHLLSNGGQLGTERALSLMRTTLSRL